MIWPATKVLINFTSTLNKMHEKLQFTVTQSDASINFLDLTIFKGNRFLNTATLDIKT